MKQKLSIHEVFCSVLAAILFLAAKIFWELPVVSAVFEEQRSFTDVENH